MVTFSLCMIVKNEAQHLGRCLESLAPYMEEIIIVDTGSTDETKKVASRYTNKIYDFTWTGSFADARNYAAAQATGDYIYTADADEYLAPEDQKKLQDLKQVLLPEIEIVQMWYCTPATCSTVYNFEREYRPKLYRRKRTFTWIDPIHETLRLDPVVFDSDIEVQHRPVGNHAARDLAAFTAMVQQNISFSKKLHHMYAMELYRHGKAGDFRTAEPVFQATLARENVETDVLREAICVLARGYRLQNDVPHFMAYALRDAITTSTAEVCCELGAFYEEVGELSEAAMWYQNALTETESIIDLRTSTEIPQAGLERCASPIDK